MDDVEAWKAGADRYALYYGDVRRLLATEYAAAVRWITASLFALNAGGLVSLASKDELTVTQQYAGYGFWFGVFLAFSYVTYSQAKSMEFLKIIQHIENAWVVAAATGDVDHQRLTKLENDKSKVSSKFAVILSIASFAMFSVAMALFAHG